MVDKSLSFGLQNFIFLKSDETDGTYNYYLYEDRKGAILIMRTNKTTSEAKYFLGTGDVDTIWTAKATKPYSYPDSLIDPTV
jgi:hypothetical protein